MVVFTQWIIVSVRMCDVSDNQRYDNSTLFILIQVSINIDYQSTLIYCKIIYRSIVLYVHMYVNMTR